MKPALKLALAACLFATVSAFAADTNSCSGDGCTLSFPSTQGSSTSAQCTQVIGAPPVSYPYPYGCENTQLIPFPQATWFDNGAGTNLAISIVLGVLAYMLFI